MNWKPIIFVAKLAVSIGILSYLFYGAAQDGQWQQLGSREKLWGWIFTGGVACLAANFISFYRWQLLIRALDLPLQLVDSIRIGFIGLFFGLFAFGPVGGDTLRAYYATRKAKNRVSAAITSVLADRLIGLLTMFSIAAIAFLCFDSSELAKIHPEKVAALGWVGWFVVACTFCGHTAMVIMYFSPRLRKTKLYANLTALPKVGDLLEKLTDVVVLYRSRMGTIAVAFLLSVGVNLCFAFSIYALAMGLTTDNPTFSNHFIIEPLAMVSNAVPLPGGIGGMEFAMKFLYLAFDSQNGVVVGFVFRFALLLVSAIGGAIWFLNRDAVASVEQVASKE